MLVHPSVIKQAVYSIENDVQGKRRQIKIRRAVNEHLKHPRDLDRMQHALTLLLRGGAKWLSSRKLKEELKKNKKKPRRKKNWREKEEYQRVRLQLAAMPCHMGGVSSDPPSLKKDIVRKIALMKKMIAVCEARIRERTRERQRKIEKMKKAFKNNTPLSRLHDDD